MTKVLGFSELGLQFLILGGFITLFLVLSLVLLKTQET